jgi:hypothetical protein
LLTLPYILCYTYIYIYIYIYDSYIVSVPWRTSVSRRVNSARQTAALCPCPCGTMAVLTDTIACSDSGCRTEWGRVARSLERHRSCKPTCDVCLCPCFEIIVLGGEKTRNSCRHTQPVQTLDFIANLIGVNAFKPATREQNYCH